MCYLALEVTVPWCRQRAHEDVSMSVGLDPMRQACQCWIGHQFRPAFEVESALLCGRLQLNRQRHENKVYYTKAGRASFRVGGARIGSCISTLLA